MFQIAVASGLSILIIILLVVVGIDTKRVADSVLDIRGEIYSQTRQSEQIAVLREEAIRAEDRQAVLEEALPKRDELFSFPNQIGSIGSQSDVGVNLTFGGEGERQIEYTLVAQGSYSNIAGFVRKLEEILFMNISSFGINQSADTYSLNLSGNVFFNGEEN